VLVFALALTGAALWAQDGGSDGDGSPIQSEWNGGNFSLYSVGDKTFAISVGALFSLGVTDANYNPLANKINTGGTLSLSYAYFLKPNLFVGGELQGSFQSTLAEHFVFIIPMSARVGWQFLYKRFEFPVSVSLGGAPQSYNGHNLFSMFMKVQGSAYFRFNSEWSFGLNTSVWWVPQWTSDNSKDAYGHFLDITASARFHF
jgi:hypothetical protein